MSTERVMPNEDRLRDDSYGSSSARRIGATDGLRNLRDDQRAAKGRDFRSLLVPSAPQRRLMTFDAN